MKPLLTASLLFTSITGFTQSYSPSPVFGTSGALFFDTWSGSENMQAHVLQPDGKLLLAGTGYWITANSYRFMVARIDTTCGQLDPTFDGDGLLNSHFEQRTKCNDLTIQANGKIVMCGNTSTSNSVSQHKPSICRLNADGSIDSTFNGAGYHKSSFDAVSSGVFWRAFVLQDGRITCVGTSIGNINGGVNGFGAQRFNPDGTLDNSFAGNGIARINSSGTGYTANWTHGTGVIQPDGKVVSIGLFSQGLTYYIGMARFNVDGTADATFGAGGLAISSVISSSNVGEGALGAMVQPDGKILVSGAVPEPIYGFQMTRFNTDGSIDTTYGSNGVSEVVMNNAVGRGMELLPDGSTLQFGTMHWNNGPGSVLKRLADGSIDTSFGNNGVQIIDLESGTTYDNLYGGFTLPSGRIMAYGGSNTGNGGEILIARITTDPASEEFLDLGPDLVLCDGDSIAVDAGSGQSWLWSNGDTTQIIQANTGGDLSATVTDLVGCTDRDTLLVTLNPLPAAPIITAAGLDLSTSAMGQLQWYFNGVAISGADQSMHTAMQNGDYTVSVTNSNGCISISDPYQITTVGLEEFDRSRELLVFPNPSNYFVTIELRDGERIEKAELIDAQGRVTAVQVGVNGQADLSSIAAGYYTLLINSRTNRRVAAPLVVE